MVTGVNDAGKALLSSALDCPVLFVVHSESAALKLTDELEPLTGAVYLPARELQFFNVSALSSEITARRLTALSALAESRNAVIVTTAEALMQRVAPPETLISASITLNVGERHDVPALCDRLLELGYTRSPVTEGKGQYSLRGGILDVFPMTGAQAVRIEFFDDEIDSMRTFDTISQRSIDKTERVSITPASECMLDPDARRRGVARLREALRTAGGKLYGRLEWYISMLESGKTFNEIESYLPLFYDEPYSLIDYLNKSGIIIADEPERIFEAMEGEHKRFNDDIVALRERGEGAAGQEKLLFYPMEIIERLDTRRTLVLQAIRRRTIIPAHDMIDFGMRDVPKYFSKLDAFAADIKQYTARGGSVLVFAGERYKRLYDELVQNGLSAAMSEALERMPDGGETLLCGAQLASGFEFAASHLAVYTEAELFGAQKHSAKPKRREQNFDFADIKPGDMIVHEVHGIGRFLGIERRTFDGNTRDYLMIQYAGHDRLFIPTDQLDRLQKYIGAGESSAPKLSKLGGAEWTRSVARAQESVKKLAFDLVELYAARSSSTGHAFSPDTVWQRQLEDRFEYTETDDQLRSIAEVKADMESPHIMDRLLCGDVGYGKTEVAVRAACKAVMDGKQVAFLVPTTILVQQHYATFSNRFGELPVKIETLSRFRTAAQQHSVMRRLERGDVDIIIGTHKLLAEDVRFHDLGLLIIDEEQRFGVGHKEKIKNMKRSVDVLTLSATPIPRTLHMSMVGIRPMSVIETPPEERYPVQTYVMEYTDALVRDAVLKEIGRGGQVYFVYNQVRDIEHVAEYLRGLIPEAAIRVAHGQMSERLLERTMLAFLDGEFNVLLCSTIIESGLDIANVNTIIVYNADQLGLSQLYQLRGRVGRSTRRGYAYFTFRQDKSLSEVSEKRLLAIREFTEFGAGFKIAMRDLELRGVGNLIGPEQHGRISDVGYELYCKLMASAVNEALGKETPQKPDTVIELPLDAHIPYDYIPEEIRRLEVYKRIASITTTEQMYDVQEELEDRFGDIPPQVQTLMDVALLKADCERAGIASLVYSAGNIRITFMPGASLPSERLIAFLNDESDARIVPLDVPVIQLTCKKAINRDFLAKTARFVHKLNDCIRA